MRKTKQFLALGLAAILMATTLAGCGGGSSDSGSGSSSGSSDAAGTEDAAGADAADAGTEADAAGGDSTSSSGDKLLVALTTSSFVTDYENNYFTNLLEEKLGFELEFYMLPTEATETRTKVALMATSNEQQPDVMITDGHLTNEMILQYGSSGFFLPLNDYVSDPEKMPNYNAIPEEDRELMNKASTQADGNIYSLSAWEPETWNLTPNRMFINKAWLDKLGLSIPTTTDELKEVLIAFRDGDPNGNGAQDELGVYGQSSGGYGENITAALMNAFVFWNGGGTNGGLALSEDGKTVIAPFTTEEWRDGLRYMNDLYNEGVLSANTFTDDNTQFKAILSQETPIVGLTSAGSLSTWPDARNNKNFLEMEFIEPLKGPKGVQYTPYNEFNPSQELSIISGTDKLDMALAFADLFFDHDISLIERFGEEGVDWTRDPELLAEHTNAYVDAGLYDGLTLLVTSTVWADNQSQTWRNHGPRYASLEMGNTTFDTAQSGGAKFDPSDPTQLNAKCYQMYYPKHPDHVLPALKYTMEEAEQLQDPLTTLPDFVKQALAEFVTGARDIEGGWDSYLKELDTMGLQQWLETAQTAYDRS